MTPIQVVLFGVFGYLIMLIVTPAEDNYVARTQPNRADIATTGLAGLESVDHDSTLHKDSDATLTPSNNAGTATISLAKPGIVDYNTSIYQDCRDRCNLKYRRMDCIDCIPQNVTSEVDEIVISKFNVTKFVPKMFCGVSWPSVINLTVLSSTGRDLCLLDFTFDCLNRITTLKLGLKQLTNISHNALYGLYAVNILDLTGCVRLKIPGLTNSLLLDTNVPKLKTLILNGVSSAFNGIRLSQDFVDILARRNVSTIDLSSCFISFENERVDIAGLCKCVERLNLANSVLVNVKCAPFSVCDSLRVIDFSGVTLPGAPIIKGNISFPSGVYTYANNRSWVNAFSGLSKIYANRMISTEHNINLNNVTLRLQFDNAINEAHISGYSIPVCDARFQLEPNHLQYLDLSNNNIQTLSSESFTDLVHLQTIDLSNNRLAVSTEFRNIFSNIFHNNAKLETVRLARNGLTRLPPGVFKFNNELKAMDLSHNRLTQITFGISHLHKLEILDFRNNAVEYLNIWSRQQVDLLYKHQREGRNTTNDGTTFILDLTDNMFSCKCHSLDFIKWFIVSPVFEGYRDTYSCEIDGEYLPMDKRAVEASQYDCNKATRKVIRLLLIILVPCVATGLLLVVSVILFKRYKRRKLLQRVKNQIYLIQENQADYTFPVFLSYASEDSKFVETNVYRPLQVRSYCNIAVFVSFLLTLYSI